MLKLLKISWWKRGNESITMNQMTRIIVIKTNITELSKITAERLHRGLEVNNKISEIDDPLEGYEDIPNPTIHMSCMGAHHRIILRKRKREKKNTIPTVPHADLKHKRIQSYKHFTNALTQISVLQVHQNTMLSKVMLH